MTHRLRAWAVDALLVAAAAVDAWLATAGTDWLSETLAVVGCAGLLLRRRWPIAVFALAMPATLVTDVLVAPLVALFTLAERYRNRPALAACALAFGITSAVPWPLDSLGAPTVLILVGYSSALAAAPVILGQLVQTRRDLARRLVDLEEAQEQQRELHAQTVLAHERAQLAREMHDVVSHQVSLIAVHAGALQVSTDSPDARDAARTIRTLSVTTLDELRHMVTLLRASGGTGSELAPQPTVAQLSQLIGNSGIEATLDGDLPTDASAPVQRAVYRTVQESLTNIRKHAPGANALITLRRPGRGLEVTVTNGTPTRQALALPGSHQGLIGLRERAELLGGTLDSGPTEDGGYRVRLHLPSRTD